MKNTGNNRQRTVVGIAFFLSVLLGCGFVVYATEPSSSEARIPNQAALSMLAQIAAAGASGQFEKAEQLFKQGKEAGLSELQMYETVLNLLPYVGYPRTLSTMMNDELPESLSKLHP